LINEDSIVKCMLTENDCYKSNKRIDVKGICVHSTGANNTSVARYVQPTATNSNKKKLQETIGTNKYNNHWNKSGVDKCVHAFIGNGNNGNLIIVQTLPWSRRGWHAGKGKKGSLNNTHIGFEICEDSLNNSIYFTKAMTKAIELCAFLCNKYKLNPMKDGVLICHSEGYRMGLASQHGDIEHWLKKFGYTMDWFREQVQNIIDENKEDNSMDTPSLWAKDAVTWAVENNISNGVDLQRPCTREEVITMIYRSNNIKKED